jgi:S-adenosyl-L-methionine hydrolase (adenosine-forming)
VIVALLTDFGTRDHYVGTMKGVILSVCPGVTIVDLTHEIPPQDIIAGAHELAAAYRYFPAGTVFLGVVDPGVGSRRRGIAADAGGYRFVGPDNGLFSLSFRDLGPVHIVELKERKFTRAKISRTFEGRDRFAPVAGWLARGTPLSAFGPPVADPVILDVPTPSVSSEAIEGEVLRVDHFGNLITNVDRETLDRFDARDVVIQIRDRRIRGLVSVYADAEPGQLCALVGSSEQLEIAVHGGSAAAMLNAGRADTIRITRGERTIERGRVEPEP